MMPAEERAALLRSVVCSQALAGVDVAYRDAACLLDRVLCEPLVALGGWFPPGYPLPPPQPAPEPSSPPVDPPWDCTQSTPCPPTHRGESFHDDVTRLGWSSFEDGTRAEVVECKVCHRLIKQREE